MTFIRNRRAVATIVVASCIALPASASADSLPPTYKSDAAQSGSAGSLPSTDRSDAAQSGWDAAVQAGAKVAYPPAGFRGGDSPVDHPGASRAPVTIDVVRPERTIVRDVDEVVPLILSSTALLLVLAGFGIVLVRTRMLPRPGASR
jgi:hypothetical protein